MLKFLCECKFLNLLSLYQRVWFLESKFSFVRNCYLCAGSVVQLCLTPCDPIEYSPPAHGIFQARTLQCSAIFYSRGSSQPRDQAHVSCVSYTGRQILTMVPPGKSCSTVIQSDYTILYYHKQWIVPVAPKLYQHLMLLVFGISAIPIDVEWYFLMS